MAQLKYNEVKRINIPRIIVSMMLICCSFFTASALHAKGDFEHPNSFIGNAGWSKGLELWIEVGEVSLGDGLSLPFRLRFTSETKGDPALFGNLWWAPLLESTKINSGTSIEFSTLGGNTKYLLPSGESAFQSQDMTASAHVTGDTCDITSAGWHYRYQNGKLLQVITPQGIGYRWEYQDGFLSFIRHESDGAPILSLTRGSDSIKIHSTFGDFSLQHESSTDKEERPWILKFPDGRQETIALHKEVQDITSMTINSPGIMDQIYRWKTSTGALLSDNDFIYEIRPNDMSELVLHKIDHTGRTEWYTFDTVKGLSTYKRQDGSRVMSWYYVAPGVTYMKPFRMDIYSKEFQLISSRFQTFDEQGAVAKAWTELGSATLSDGPGVRYANLEKAEELQHQAGVLFVDARNKQEFNKGHIDGALHLARSNFEWDYPELEKVLQTAKLIVVYCKSRQCEESSVVATRLAQLGCKNILIYEGGWAEWRQLSPQSKSQLH